MILAWISWPELGDAAGDVQAVGRRAIYSDADPGDDAYRSGRVLSVFRGK